MPRTPKRSKESGLFKDCQHLSWDKCECPWLGRFREVRYINLAKWAAEDSLTKTKAKEVLAELRRQVRGAKFDKRGMNIALAGSGGTAADSRCVQ
jgi:hypothetical protein